VEIQRLLGPRLLLLFLTGCLIFGYPILGLFSQPFSCIGLPVATVPVFPENGLPIGIQLIAAPWREDLCLRAAAWLEAEGVVAARPPALQA